jgi:hypothetical protein
MLWGVYSSNVWQVILCCKYQGRQIKVWHSSVLKRNLYFMISCHNTQIILHNKVAIVNHFCVLKELLYILKGRIHGLWKFCNFNCIMFVCIDLYTFIINLGLLSVILSVTLSNCEMSKYREITI